MSDTIPSKYAVCPVEFGEKRAFLYTEGDVTFCTTKVEAEDCIAQALSEGYKTMALLTVEGLYRAKPIQIEKI